MPDPRPFDLLDGGFRRLCQAAPPLALPGETVGLPVEELNLFDIRESLLRHDVPYATRDALLAELVRRALAEGEPWGTGLVGVILPGLRARVGPQPRLPRGCGRPRDRGQPGRS